MQAKRRLRSHTIAVVDRSSKRSERWRIGKPACRRAETTFCLDAAGPLQVIEMRSGRTGSAASVGFQSQTNDLVIPRTCGRKLVQAAAVGVRFLRGLTTWHRTGTWLRFFSSSRGQHGQR